MNLFAEVIKEAVMVMLEAIGFALLIRCLLSMFASEDSKLLGFCCAVTEPLMAPVRAVLDKTAIAELPIDLSYLICYFLVMLCQMLLLSFP